MRNLFACAARPRTGAVILQAILIAAAAACTDDTDRATPSSRLTGPNTASFGKGQDKGGGPSTTRRIAFIGQFHRLSTMKPDGTDLVQLPGANAAEDADPVLT